MHFIKSKNLDDDLQVEANSSGILIDARQIREYFEIEYNENLGDILQEFIEILIMGIEANLTLIKPNC